MGMIKEPDRLASWRDTPANHGPYAGYIFHGGPQMDCVHCGKVPLVDGHYIGCPVLDGAGGCTCAKRDALPMPTLDLDELERKAKDGWEGLNDDLSPRTILALIERVRAAEIVGGEWMALQEAAGFPKDGMVRSVKDVSDSVVLMAERLRELEKRDREWQASTGLMHPETDG